MFTITQKKDQTSSRYLQPYGSLLRKADEARAAGNEAKAVQLEQAFASRSAAGDSHGMQRTEQPASPGTTTTAAAPAGGLTEEQIAGVYRDLLGGDRTPSAEALNYWMNDSQATTVDQLRDAIMQGDEYKGLQSQAPQTFSNVDRTRAQNEILNAYRNRYGSEPPQELVKQYVDPNLSQSDLSNLLQQVNGGSFSPSGSTGGGSTVNPTQGGSSNPASPGLLGEDYTSGLNSLYQDLLGRGIQQEGVDYWTNHLQNDGWSMDQVRNAIMQGDEYQNMQQTQDPMSYITGNASAGQINTPNYGQAQQRPAYNFTPQQQSQPMPIQQAQVNNMHNAAHNNWQSQYQGMMTDLNQNTANQARMQGLLDNDQYVQLQGLLSQ